METTKENLKENKESQLHDPEPPLSIQQALDAAKLLGMVLFFCERNPTAFDDMNDIYMKIQAQYWLSKKHQTKITDYIQ